MRIKKPRRPYVIFVVGPTATGKTELAVRLAEKIRGEIVSCDSMQVYRGMPILSQAPGEKDMRSVRHHMVGMIDPVKEFSVASFRRKANRAIDSVVKRGRIPVVAGGTGLYVKALIDGLFEAPGADIEFRARMRRYAARYGSARLHAKLANIDPASADLIHPNDIRRTIRALEIFELTGRTMTELKSLTSGLAEKYDVKVFGLDVRRDRLYSRIGARVDSMFDGGVVAEVKRLLRKNLSKTARAALGLKEICGYLKGSYDLETAKDMLKMNTRRFAKRQLTWFRADKRIRWFDISRNTAAKISMRIAKEVR